MSLSIDVVVVDDRSVDADATLFALSCAAPKARVLRLKNGDEALRYLFALGEFSDRSGGMPGLLLLRTEVPTMSGSWVLDVIRAHPATRSIPVVMLSTDTLTQVFQQQSRFSADAYLVRPLELDDYCAAIEAMLRRWLPRILSPHGRTRLDDVSPARRCLSRLYVT